ncbi:MULTISPECIES: GNAT family N-acetyltransferase [unclassified Isoptericola]|uniref:GNAT family N-acetyltransferase n=1 Tax=unclassified Isoptericola TaxID=2623355 RepID=UPI00365F2B54
MHDPTPAWQLTEDPQAFLDAVAGVLAADPVRATIVATTAQRLMERAARGEPAPDHPHWFAVARTADGEVAGAAMRTAPAPPYQAHLMPMDARLATSLADLLLARGEVVPAANGAQGPATAFLRRMGEHAGGDLELARPSRLFELGTLVPPARAPGGGPRLVAADELDVAHAWIGDFAAAADAQAGRAPGATVTPPPRDTVERRVADRKLWWWEDDGEPVSLVGFMGPALGVARIGPVYTPAVHRGRGYAGALVAHVSALLRDAGHRVCLFTDLENPVSNALYERLGYRKVVDMGELRIAS